MDDLIPDGVQENHPVKLSDSTLEALKRMGLI